MLSPETSQRLLYASVILSAYAVYKHTAISIGEIFPVLNTALGPKNAITFSAKCMYLQMSATLVTMTILQLKWAKYGVTGRYDKVLLAWYIMTAFLFGVGYAMEGWYLPLIPTWGIPALVGLSQL